MHIYDICSVGTIYFGGLYCDIFHVCNFLESPFYCCYNAGFFCELTRIFLLDYYCQI
jgi:hypothetical protein